VLQSSRDRHPRARGRGRSYQQRGFVLAAIHRNALEQSRKLKPEIPLVGSDGISLRDEIELEMMLDGEER